MDYEKGLIAACLQDTELFKRTARAKVTHSHFRDKDCSYLFKVMTDLAQQGSEVNEHTVLMSVSLKKDIEKKHKDILTSKVKSYANQSLDFKQFSINTMVEKRRMFDIMRNLVAVTEKIHNHTATADELEKELSRLAKDASNSGQEIDVVEYNTINSWNYRVAERHAISLSAESDGAGYLKVAGYLDFLADYFPLGFPPQTLTGVSGMTGVGKSHFMNAFAFMSIMPVNACNVLYFISENRRIETESRLDSIFLERTYASLYTEAQSDPVAEEVFANQKKKGWGRLFTSKVVVDRFDINTIEQTIEFVEESFGTKISVIIIDSPDHMVPSTQVFKMNERKAAVYKEIKAMADSKSLVMIVSIPQKAGSVGKSDISSDDVAGSYDIPRILDNLIMFLHCTQDDFLHRRRIKVAKLRGNALDGKIIPLRLKNDLTFTLWEELNDHTDEPIEGLTMGEDGKLKFSPVFEDSFIEEEVPHDDN